MGFGIITNPIAATLFFMLIWRPSKLIAVLGCVMMLLLWYVGEEWLRDLLRDILLFMFRRGK